MKVINVHERELPTSPARVGALLDSLSSPQDALWPAHSWPPMRFDRPLSVGARGGHGPVGYIVEAYAPGESIRFRFTAPKGFDGCHWFDVRATGPDGCVLRHTIEMTAHGRALLSWPLAIRFLHDALLEDALATAQASLGLPPLVRKWSAWVKVLRWLVAGGKSSAQVTPAISVHAG